MVVVDFMEGEAVVGTEAVEAEAGTVKCVEALEREASKRHEFKTCLTLSRSPWLVKGFWR